MVVICYHALMLQSSFRQEVSEVMLCSTCKRKLRLQNDTLLRLQNHLLAYHCVVEDGEKLSVF